MQFKIYTHLHRVTYADCSNGNHVYYGRYSYFLEEARGEFFRYLGITFNDYHKNGYLFPVSEFQLKYFAPAEYDDELIIECNITKFHGARLGFGYRIKKNSSLIVVEGETLHGCTDLNNNVRRLPPNLKNCLKLYIANEPNR